MGLFQRKEGYTPIGLHVRDSGLYATQFRIRGGAIEQCSTASWPTEPTQNGSGQGRTLFEALRRLAEDPRFSGRRVVTSLPGSQVDVRPIRLPAGVTPESPTAFEEALMLEVGSVLPYPADEAQIDYIALGEEIEDGRKKCAVLLVAARREHVNRHLALLQTVHFECLHLGVASAAAIRMLRQPESNYFALLDMDTGSSAISIGRGQNLLFSRAVGLGTQAIVDSLTRDLGLPAGEARIILAAHGVDPECASTYDLARARQSGRIEPEALPGVLFASVSQSLKQVALEAKRTIDYFLRQRRCDGIDRVFLTGVGVPPGLERYLESQLHVPVAIANVMDGPGEEPDEASGAPARPVCTPYAGAAGLALRGFLPTS